MDPKKAEMKNIGNKLTEEDENIHNKDMTAQLSNLNKISENKKIYN